MSEFLLKLRKLKVEPWNMTEANRIVQGGPPDRANREPVAIIVFEGTHYLVDGHHRVARAVQDLTDKEALGVEVHGLMEELTHASEWVWGPHPFPSPDNWVWFEEWLDQR